MAEPVGVQDTAVVPTVLPPSRPALAALSVAQAAARVGLTAATLRTWDRRYGMSPSVRTPGGHRRYDATDVARLRAVGALVDAGVPAAQAVATGLALSEADLSEPIRPAPSSGGPPGGGRVLPLPGGSEAQRGLARAADSLDGPAVTRAVAGLLAEHGVVATWSDVLVDVLVAVGERWGRTRRGVEVEHVLSDGIARALAEHGTPVPILERPVLLACVPEEQHSLPLLALQAALRERTVPSVLFGSRVPRPALLDAVRRLRPCRLVLWAQVPELADVALLASVPVQRPPVRLVLAGPGWARLEGEDVARPLSLREAVATLAGAA